MSKTLVTSLGFLMITACGAPQTAPTLDPETPAPKRLTYSDELGRAKRLRLDAEALEPPVPEKLDDQKTALAFLNGEVSAWIEQRRSAVERASTAYAEVVPRLPDAEKANAALATGDMQLSFRDDFERVTLAAAPPLITKDATLLEAFRNNLRDAASPQFSKARSAFHICVATAERAGLATIAATCRARLARLAGPATVVATPPVSTPRPTVAVLPRPFLPARQIGPCVFAGTLKLWRAPLTVAPQGPAVARFEHVEIERLTLPAKAADGFRLSLAWPIRGNFTLEQHVLPFDLRSRLDLVQGHIWLSAGSAVSAIAAGAGKATVLRPQPANEALRSSPEPARVLSCSELELAGQRPTSHAADKGEKLTLLGEVQLSAAPKGETLGVLRLRDALVVRAIERRSGWTRVAAEDTTVRGFGASAPYDFDAWTQAAPSDQTAFGMVGILDPRTAPTHVTTSEIELYEAPGAKSFAKVVTGVAILAGETRSGFVEVSVPGLLPGSTEQWGFWVPEQSFRAGTQVYQDE